MISQVTIVVVHSSNSCSHSQVVQASVLVSAKRILTQDGVDYDVEYDAVSPTSASPVVPTVTNTTKTANGTTVTTQSTYSTNATVPAVKMAATLSDYTLDSFNAAEQARVCSNYEHVVVFLTIVVDIDDGAPKLTCVWRSAVCHRA